MTTLQKIVNVVVGLLFVMMGISSVTLGVSTAWRLKTWAGPYFQSEWDILAGILCFIPAVGLYRFDPRARVLGISLTGFFCLACAAALLVSPTVAPGGWLVTALTVLFWFFWPEVRSQFAQSKPRSQVV